MNTFAGAARPGGFPEACYVAADLAGTSSAAENAPALVAEAGEMRLKKPDYTLLLCQGRNKEIVW